MPRPSTALLAGALLMLSLPAAAMPPEIKDLVDAGDFTQARTELVKAAATAEGDEARALLFEAERLDRIRRDWSLTAAEILEVIRKDIPDATPGDVDAWTAKRFLEARPIDGQPMYFRYTARNLFRLSPEARERRAAHGGDASVPAGDRTISMEDRMAAYLAERRASDSAHVAERRFVVTYALEVKPDVVPAGEVVRCWLPFPREVPSQSGIALLRSDPQEATLAPDDALQRTVYLERPAVAGEPVRFEIAFSLAIHARVEFVDPAKVLPADPSSPVVQQYTAEEPGHLEFTPRLRALAREIVGDETNPYLKARRIFGHIDGNIRYTSVPEYSTIPNLSEFCAAEGRGDCGIQGMLFIVLCRLSGVPAKWQSGWSLLPERAGMHDWAEFYVEPYGWLPADPSRGCRPSEEDSVRWFNFGNMDPYRLVVNDDFGRELVPPKKHFRSEPVDFQRGEVEWNGGNLYYDDWTWKINVEHLTPEGATAQAGS